jgi:hypothetical protein
MPGAAPNPFIADAMSYQYAMLPLSVVHELAIVPLEDGAFVSQSIHSEKARSLFAAGYRWIRTEGDFAILERNKEEAESDLRTVIDVASKNLPRKHPTIERIRKKHLIP